MKGLIKNNFYAAVSNVKFFSAVMVFLGTFFIVAAKSDGMFSETFIGYSLLCITGFSVLAILSLRKENASKWEKYKLTVPVKRSDIVKSYYISQLVWLAIGIGIAAVMVGFYILFHGFPFDRLADIFVIPSAGASVILLMDAIFFPALYWGGAEKSEVLLIISLACSIGIVMKISEFLNWLFGKHMTTLQLFLGMGILLSCALTGFLASIPIAVKLFERKEY